MSGIPHEKDVPQPEEFYVVCIVIYPIMQVEVEVRVVSVERFLNLTGEDHRNRLNLRRDTRSH